MRRDLFLIRSSTASLDMLAAHSSLTQFQIRETSGSQISLDFQNIAPYDATYSVINMSDPTRLVLESLAEGEKHGSRGLTSGTRVAQEEVA